MSASSKLVDWDLSVVKRYLVQKGIYPQDEIEEVEREYKRFLTLCFVFPQVNFAMSQNVDDFWHCHILFTQDYTSMCKEVGNTYLHHRPAILDSDAELSEAFAENTLRAYSDFFGNPDVRRWDAVVCRCHNNCSAESPSTVRYADLVSA